jgi:hypothetical protein
MSQRVPRRRRWWPALLAVLALGAASACDQRAAFEQLIPAAEAAQGRQVFDQLQRRQFEPIEAMMSDRLRETGPTRPPLEQMATVFPGGSPTVARVVGAFTRTIDGVRFVELTHEYEFSGRWLLANVLFRQDGPGLVIERMQVVRTADSQERLNAFTFHGKGLLHYVMLVLVAITPVFVIAVFVLLLRTKVPRRKWLWAIAVLLGVGQVGFDWTSGRIGVQPFMVLVLGAAFVKGSPYSPLVLTWAAPIGAAVVLWKRRRWQAEAARRGPVVDPPPPPWSTGPA